MKSKFKAFFLSILLSILGFRQAMSDIPIKVTSHNMKTPIVGILRTEKELYPEETKFSDNIADMISNMGAKIVMIDYNTIVAFDQIKDKSILEAKGDQNMIAKIEATKIKAIVSDFITSNGINRVFIPGNYYNLDHEPYAPTPNRQLITKALVEIAKDHPKIHIMGVCGGLQGIMHSQGIEIIRVQKILKTQEGVDSHVVSMPDPHHKDVHLHKMKVVPKSRLATIVSQYVTADENGWFSLFFPDAHGGVVNNSKENIELLESLNYKITGFSEDGIIEAIEDKYGNVSFQDHPESLVINAQIYLKNLKDTSEKDALLISANKEKNSSTLAAIAIFNDFLYRKD